MTNSQQVTEAMVEAAHASWPRVGSFYSLRDALRDALEAALSSQQADEDPHRVIHLYEGDGALIVRDGGNMTLMGVQHPALRAGMASEAAPGAQAATETETRVERLMNAVEGECDGLAIDAATAKRILDHVDEAALSVQREAPSEAVVIGGVTQWPPIKKALWRVVTGEELNTHYVNAWDLTEKLYQAALTEQAEPTQVAVPDMFWPDDAEECFESVGDYADQSGEREVVCKVRCAKSLPSRWAYAEYIDGRGWVTSFFDTEAEALAAPSHAAPEPKP